MKKARLFYTTWGSPRRAILSLALIGVFAAALVFGLGATPAFAEDPAATPPGPVTNLTVEVSDTAVKVNWTPPTTTGNCKRPGIYVSVYEVVNNSDVEVLTIITNHRANNHVLEYKDLMKSSRQAWGIKRSTMYAVDVRSIGGSCPGTEDAVYSSPAYERFTTGPPPKPKMPPNRPKKLKFSPSDDSVTISWKAAGNSAKRCAPSSYSMYMGNHADPLISGFVPVIRHGISGTSAKVSGLTSGHKYEVHIASHSSDCEQYSAVVRKTYTHP